MFNRFSIKKRMFVIIVLIAMLFAIMAWSAVKTGGGARDVGMELTGDVMLADQKAKLKAATHSLAAAVATVLKKAVDEEKKQELINGMLNHIRYGEDDTGYYFTCRGTVTISHIKKSLIGKDLGKTKDKNGVYFVKEMKEKAEAGGGFVRYLWEKPGAGDTPKLSYAEMIPGTDYWIGTGVYIDNIKAYQSEMKGTIDRRVNSMITKLLTVTGIIFAGIVVLCLVIVFGITGGLNFMISSFRDIAEGEGDLTRRIEIKSRDELGVLAEWYNTFLEKLQKIIRQVAKESASVDQSSDELTRISEGMSREAESMSDKAKTVAAAAEELSTGMNSVAASMEQSSSNANMVASAAEEMNSTINEIAGNAEQAREISAEAAGKTGEAAMEMAELKKAASSVGRVVETITDISEQVNLLALNATIEAARAGESGRGFAVVANEIKALANQTAEATYDIKSQIANIQTVSSRTEASISEVTAAIDNTRDIVTSIASAIEEQSAATSEISSNVEQLSSGIQTVNENVAESSQVTQDMSQDITGVSSASAEISDSSSRVRENSVQLKEMAAQLNAVVETFKTE